MRSRWMKFVKILKRLEFFAWTNCLGGVWEAVPRSPPRTSLLFAIVFRQKSPVLSAMKYLHLVKWPVAFLRAGFANSFICVSFPKPLFFVSEYVCRSTPCSFHVEELSAEGLWRIQDSYCPGLDPRWGRNQMASCVTDASVLRTGGVRGDVVPRALESWKVEARYHHRSSSARF